MRIFPYFDQIYLKKRIYLDFTEETFNMIDYKKDKHYIYKWIGTHIYTQYEKLFIILETSDQSKEIIYFK